MRPDLRSLRGLICALLALAFVVAAQPGVMAMPTGQPMAMAGAQHGPACDRMAPHHKQSAPCKDMGICLGMLSCYGMAALTVDSPVFPRAVAPARALSLHNIVSGLTLQPDSPPPIA